MSIPPLLIAAAAAFWGFETGDIIVGLLLALLLGSVLFVPARWSLSDRDFAGISDLTSVLFLAAVALVLLNIRPVLFLKTLVHWLPLILLPLIMAQLYSNSAAIMIGTRLGLRRDSSYMHKPIDFRLYYFAVCLFSAGVANSRSLVFYPAIGILLFVLLNLNRSQSFSRLTFLLVFSTALVAGYYSYQGAEQVHAVVRSKTRMLIYGYFDSRSADPYQTHLSFGTIGRLKSSGRIILRLQEEDHGPELLRLASYETFNKQSWHSTNQFEYLIVSNLGWDLLPPPYTPDRKVTIEYYLPREKGLLPHPHGSYRLSGPTIYELEQKNDGIVRVIDGASLITYTILYNRQVTRSGDNPTPRNLAIHQEEQPLFQQIVEQVAMDGMSLQEKVQAVESFFRDGFAYSLRPAKPGRDGSWLEDFLSVNRTGHCELFATATTLLLRAAGVPSRYVTGYVVSEWSEMEKKFIVRERHAHAWSEAFVDGRWVVVDTTPADWFSQEAQGRSRFEVFRDFFAYLRLHYDHFRLRAEQNYKQALSAAVVVLSLILVFRIYRRMRLQNVEVEQIPPGKSFDAVESPFYQMEEKLKELAPSRQKEEPFLQWVGRIHVERDIDVPTIEKLYGLHLQLRFDPAGISEEQRGTLAEEVETWLTTYGRPAGPEQVKRN